MIVVYADGGGLGHLTRVQSLRHTLGLDGPVTVVTSSVHADDDRVVGGLRTVALTIRRDDLAARRSWLQRTLAELEPTLIVVDAFPAGLGGEIDATTVPISVPLVHVARLLRWSAYRRVLPRDPVRYERSYVLEPLHAEHQRHLVERSGDVLALDLVDPPPEGSMSALSAWPAAAPAGDRPRWLIAHAGPASEVAELVAYARDQAEAESVTPILVVASPLGAAPPAAPDLVLLDRYPVWPLFGSADRIVTAAGFNVMRQLAGHRDRHRFVAMPRRYDDQPERARRARALVP